MNLSLIYWRIGRRPLYTMGREEPRGFYGLHYISYTSDNGEVVFCEPSFFLDDIRSKFN